MDRDEVSGTASHITTQDTISGITVTVYLNSTDWRELTENGSVEVSQRDHATPAGAKVVQVTVYQR
jgi:hypothetical protein